MAANASNSAVKRFSGEGLSAVEDYRRWKKWARAYLKTQSARGTAPGAFGSILYTLLDGQALLAVDGVDPDDLEQDGGEHLIFDKLDDRYPEQATQDKIGEVLDNVFTLRVDRGESTAAFVGRARAAFEQAAREGIDFPSVARGYMLVRAARLPEEKKAIVLAASRRSYEEPEVAAALRSTFPNLGTDRRTGIHAVDAAPVDSQEDPGTEGDAADDADVAAIVGAEE